MSLQKLFQEYFLLRFLDRKQNLFVIDHLDISSYVCQEFTSGPSLLSPFFVVSENMTWEFFFQKYFHSDAAARKKFFFILQASPRRVTMRLGIHETSLRTFNVVQVSQVSAFFPNRFVQCNRKHQYNILVLIRSKGIALCGNLLLDILYVLCLLWSNPVGI